MENKKIKKEENLAIALIDNNILDKSIYITDEKFWTIEEVMVPYLNETVKIIRATKKFFHKQTQQEVYQILEGRGRLPDHKDHAVLVALISLAQEQKSDRLVTSYYKIIDRLRWSKNDKIYSFVRESLNVWHNFKISFQKCFYTHDEGYVTFSTYVITSLEEKTKEGKVIIQFEPRFFETLFKNRFFTSLHVPDYCKLSSGFQRRLYEILSKSFNNRLTFEIGWETLKEKTEDSSKYKSDFLKKLTRAVNSINERTSLKLEFTMKNENILFRVLNEEKVKFFNLVWFLENYKEKYRVDENFVMLFKNKCTLKINEKTKNYILVCADKELKEKILQNESFKNILFQHRIDFII